MIVKTIAGKIYGADLTKKEREAMSIEIRKQIAVENEANAAEVDAIIPWILFNEYDFEEDDLKRFHATFLEKIKELTKRYELPGSDAPWLCTKKLLDKGIDIRAWNGKGEKE